MATPMAMFIGSFKVSGCSKLEVVPGGGASAGVRVALVVCVDISPTIFCAAATNSQDGSNE